MLTYCLKFRKNTGNLDLKISQLKITDLLFNQNVLCVVVKNQCLWKKNKQKGLLSSLRIKTQLNKVSLLGDILF